MDSKEVFYLLPALKVNTSKMITLIITKIQTYFSNLGRKWKHPFDSSLVFDIPDQIDTINTLPGGVLNTKTTLIETVDDYKKSMSVDMGLDVNTVAYGAYSASGSYKKAQENLINSTKSIVEVR